MAPAADEGGLRYEKKTRAAPTKSGKLDDAFKNAKAEEAKKAKRDPKLMSGSDFARKRSGQNIDMVERQVELTTRLIRATEKSSPEYPELMLRLADHHVELKTFYDQQSSALWDKIWAAEDKKDAASVRQYKEQQKRLDKKKKDSSVAAAKVYGALVRDPAFKSYARLDEALFYYAFELGELGQDTEMQKAYKRLIDDFPNSQYIAQGYLAFADYYYGKDQIENAARLYERVTSFKDSPVYAYALYKLGWCYLNPFGTAEPRYDKSLNYFLQTIQATLEGRAGSEANGKLLRADTRRDLIRAFIKISKPSKAWDFFTKWGNGPGKDENDARKMMLLAANGYFAEGMYAESTFAYKQLQEIFPDDGEVCNWQSKIIVNTFATDDKNIQWREAERLGEVYTAFKEGKASKAEKAQCTNSTRDTLTHMATVWHDEAIKTKIPETFALAEKAYGKLIEFFPKDKASYEHTFYYADLLWDLAAINYAKKDEKDRKLGLELFRKSHNMHMRVLELDPKGKFAKESAYAQLLALRNALEYDETGAKSKGCKVGVEGVCVYDEGKKKQEKVDKDGTINVARDYPPTDYTESEKEMLAAADTYAKYVDAKDDKELPNILFYRAKVMTEHNHFDEALPAIEQVLTKFDGTIYAAFCAEMLVDILNIRWQDSRNTPEQTVAAGKEIAKWGEMLKKSKTWSHPEGADAAKTMEQLLMGLGWREAKAYSDAGTRFVKGEPGGDPQGFSKCKDRYLDVFNTYENHEKADALLYSAAICAEAGYQVKHAIDLRKALLETFDKSQYRKETTHKLAGNYQAIASYRDAATQFESYAKEFPGDEKTPEALTNAYLFRLGLGDVEQANADLKAFESHLKKKDKSKAAGVFWARFATLKTDEEKLRHALDYIKSYGKDGGADRLAVAHAAAGEILWRQSCPKGLHYDSCIEVTRTKSVAGAKSVAERKKLEQKAKRAEARKSKRYQVPERCGQENQAILTVYPRDKKKVGEAQKHFAETIKLGRQKIDIPKEEVDRIDSFKYFLGAAMVYAADLRYEEYLQVNIPTGLTFHVEEWRKGQGVAAWDKLVAKQQAARDDSVKRLKEYNERKTKSRDELVKAYGEVLSAGSPYWALAGAARTGMVSRNFADQLYRAEVPDEIKDEDSYLAYCDGLADMARPAEEAAQNAFGYCISKSTEFKYFNVYSGLCEEEMQQLDADKYPATNEYFGTSVYTQSKIVAADVMTNPSGEMVAELKRDSDKPAPAAEEGTN